MFVFINRSHTYLKNINTWWFGKEDYIYTTVERPLVTVMVSSILNHVTCTYRWFTLSLFIDQHLAQILVKVDWISWPGVNSKEWHNVSKHRYRHWKYKKQYILVIHAVSIVWTFGEHKTELIIWAWKRLQLTK